MAAPLSARAVPSYTLLTLGRASLVDSAGTVVGEQRRRIALLALVMSAGERGITRDRLMACLSPERSTESARHALHQLLYFVRRQIGDDVFLGIDPLRIDPVAIRWDVADFDAALESGHLAEAVALYRGPFLDGLHVDSAEFESWVDGQRSNLAARYADALRRLAAEAENRADWSGAITLWSQLAALDPLSGRYALGLLRVLAASGDVSGALRHFRAYQSAVGSELGSAVEPEITAFVRSLTRPAATVAGAPTGTVRHGRGAPRVRRLAVFPLVSVTKGSAAAAALAEGITRELISALTRAGVRVMGHQSVAGYTGAIASVREAARTLGVDAVATGRMEQRGDAIALTLSVVQPGSGEVQWTTSVAAESARISSLASTAAHELAVWIVGHDVVARNARLELAPVTSAEAYTSYLLGMRRCERPTALGVREAIADLEHAVVADQQFALAHAGLAFVLSVAIDYAILPADEAFRAAAPAIELALKLDPHLALAHLAKARVLQLRDWNWKDAEAEYLEAIDLEPSSRAFQIYGWFLEWYVGRADEGVAMSERAVGLDPSSVIARLALAWRLRGADRLDRAVAEANIALALDPLAGDAHWILAEVYLRRLDFEQAEHHARQYILTCGDAVPANSTTLGELYARTGRVAEARAYAARLELRAMHDGPSSVALARTQMALGNVDRALSQLEHAVERRAFTIPFQPYWDPIRDHPRFQAILRAQGL